MGVNYIVLAGEVLADPEKKFTPDGSPVANFNLLIPSNDNEGDTIKIIALKKLAEECLEKISSGDFILTEGRLYTKSTEDKFHKRTKSPFVQASNIKLVRKKKVVYQKKAESNENYSEIEDSPF